MARKNQEPDSDDPMRATADSLVRIATKAFMRMHNVDYETAQRWIAGAVLDQEENKRSARKSKKVR